MDYARQELWRNEAFTFTKEELNRNLEENVGFDAWMKGQLEKFVFSFEFKSPKTTFSILYKPIYTSRSYMDLVKAGLQIIMLDTKK